MIGAHVAPPLAKEALVGTVCCMFESNIYQYEQHLFTLVNSNEVNDIKEREREREREREAGRVVIWRGSGCVFNQGGRK